MSQLWHGHITVRDALTWPDSRKKGLLRDKDTNAPLMAREVDDALLDALNLGLEVLPVGMPCENFDYRFGCLGHKQQSSVEWLNSVVERLYGHAGDA